MARYLNEYLLKTLKDKSAACRLAVLLTGFRKDHTPA